MSLSCAVPLERRAGDDVLRAGGRRCVGSFRRKSLRSRDGAAPQATRRRSESAALPEMKSFAKGQDAFSKKVVVCAREAALRPRVAVGRNQRCRQDRSTRKLSRWIPFEGRGSADDDRDRSAFHRKEWIPAGFGEPQASRGCAGGGGGGGGG
ncbi:hypothetical protein ACHAWF_001251 [Thalassiosira exigua]